MEASMISGVIVACLLVGSIGVAEAYAEVIHIGGKVLCQDCSDGWNEWVRGAKPIKGGKVSVTCMDERSRVVYYGSDFTDEQGVFDLIVYGKALKPRLCSVRLVWSPDTACNLLTNFGGGRSGVKLNTPSFVYRDMIKYVTGPFYFTTPMCDYPNTSD